MCMQKGEKGEETEDTPCPLPKEHFGAQIKWDLHSKSSTHQNVFDGVKAVLLYESVSVLLVVDLEPGVLPFVDDGALVAAEVVPEMKAHPKTYRHSYVAFPSVNNVLHSLYLFSSASHCLF